MINISVLQPKVIFLNQIQRVENLLI
jgi:hypothetical protein